MVTHGGFAGEEGSEDGRDEGPREDAGRGVREVPQEGLAAPLGALALHDVEPEALGLGPHGAAPEGGVEGRGQRECGSGAREGGGDRGGEADAARYPDSVSCHEAKEDGRLSTESGCGGGEDGDGACRAALGQVVGQGHGARDEREGVGQRARCVEGEVELGTCQQGEPRSGAGAKDVAKGTPGGAQGQGLGLRGSEWGAIVKGVFKWDPRGRLLRNPTPWLWPCLKYPRATAVRVPRTARQMVWPRIFVVGCARTLTAQTAGADSCARGRAGVAAKERVTCRCGAFLSMLCKRTHQGHDQGAEKGAGDRAREGFVVI